MRACVTSTGTDLASPVDLRFGRAANLLLVDTETWEVHRLEGATGSSRGAGVLAAQSVIRAGASALVTGQIGPMAYDALAAAGVPVYVAPHTTVERAIRDLTAGRLQKSTTMTIDPHGEIRA